MLEINKIETNNVNQFEIKKNNKLFYIMYGGDLDIHFYSNNLDKNDKISFYIDLSDDYFYYLIDELYNDIKNVKYFKDNNLNINESNKLINTDDEHNVFYNGYIDFHSDLSKFNDASRLIIKEINHNYIIDLIAGKENNNIIDVRISNSKSRYGNINLVFMKLYNNLCNYDFKKRKLIK